MQNRIVIACAFGVLACEPQPLLVVQATPTTAYVQTACVQPTPIYDQRGTNKQEACDDVVRACAAGGYYSGGMDVGLGVLVDCLEPLRHGKPVARVSVAPATLHACFGPNLDDAEGDRMATNRAADLAPPPRLPRRR